LFLLLTHSLLMALNGIVSATHSLTTNGTQWHCFCYSLTHC